MIETIKYTRKPFDVDAVQVTDENLIAVSNWCDGVIQQDENNRNYIKVNVERPLHPRQTKAYPGDWVLFAGKGFKVYTSKAFHKSFDRKGSEVTMQPTEDEPQELLTVTETTTQVAPGADI